MKKYLILALFLFGFGLMNAQSMKIVVDSNGEAVGRYVKTNKTTYSIIIQGDCTIPKKGHKVVTFSAANGQGVVYYNQSRTGSFNVRQRPTTTAPVVAIIPDSHGSMPECYDCLGKKNGWYKIEIDGKTGYVRADLMTWDGMCTF